MKVLSEILALYIELDRKLQSDRATALAAGSRQHVARVEQKQVLNDQAYFIMCWGQLETEIDDACRTLIRRRRANASWDMRRGFDFYDPDDRRLSGLAFDRRLSLVLDRNGEQDRAWARVISYYETRNRIAHGRLLTDRIDVATMIKDFYVIQGEITS